jgi:hypothetical protein
VDPANADPLRSEGYEFAAIRVPTFLNSINLVVSLPVEFAPGEKPEVFYQNARLNEPRRQARDLSDRLTPLGIGMYSLIVPYPLKDFRYIIAWKPPSLTSTRQLQSTVAGAFVATAQQRGAALSWKFHEALAGTPLSERVSVSLYVPAQTEREVLALVGSYPAAAADGPARTVRIGRECTAITDAWRGNIQVIPAPPTDHALADKLGFVRGDRGLITLPIRFSLNNTNDAPWGVVRLGIREINGALADWLGLSRATPLRTALLRPMLAVLNEADIGVN